jgi:hypothetical protein
MLVEDCLMLENDERFQIVPQETIRHDFPLLESTRCMAA